MNKYIISLAVALTASMLTSCLDDQPLFTDNGDYGIVELDLSGNRAVTAPYASMSFSRTDSSILSEQYKTLPIDAVINYTGVNGAPNDVTVTVEIDDAIVTKYNSFSKVIALPAAAYKLPASNTLLIPKGKKTAVYTINVNLPTLEKSVATYGIGLKITSASDGRISGNFGAGIYLIK
ncbi:MAG: DUF1735 domain-containing protein [Tannerellaceae bacterium]|jgi:hypothetical protein|nr:DUF1735 domain-containing protein [Tannerellaceae bacterium]